MQSLEDGTIGHVDVYVLQDFSTTFAIEVFIMHLSATANTALLEFC